MRLIGSIRKKSGGCPLFNDTTIQHPLQPDIVAWNCIHGKTRKILTGYNLSGKSNMLLLTPNALYLGLLALPILLLYMLRLRRREVLVSSNLLWEQLLRDRQANTPWQRLKRNLLLLIQLLILACLVLALSRPAMPVPAVTSGPVIVLLDASASMNATDISPSRFEAARDYTHTLITDLDEHDQMTLILVGDQPIVLASAETDKTTLHAALDSAEVSQGMSSWAEAFSLAAGAHTSTVYDPNRQPTTIILSDGGLPNERLPGLSGDVRYMPFGNSNQNVAISALSLRSTGESAELFTHISNYSDTARTVLLSIYRQNSLLLAEQVTIPAGGQESRILSGLADTAAIFQASLSDPIKVDQPLDVFNLDNHAFVAYQPASPGRTLLVTAGNLFLEQALAVLPDLTPFRMVPDESSELTLPTEPFNLLVLDGVYPSEPALPPGNLLLINPPANPLFEISGTYTVTASLRAASDPLVSNIDPGTIHVSQASQVELPTWAKPLLYTDQGPLLFSGETLGRRVAVFCFDLHQSDLPLQVAFPILMAQLSSYLVPPHGIQGSGSLQPGESLEILPPLQTDQVLVVGPSGATASMTPGEATLLFTQTYELGLYTVNYLSEAESTSEYFVVNLFSDRESDIQPAEHLTIGSVPLSASDQNALSMRPLWPWFVATTLILLLLEWGLYHGRLRLPGQRGV